MNVQAVMSEMAWLKTLVQSLLSAMVVSTVLLYGHINLAVSTFFEISLRVSALNGMYGFGAFFVSAVLIDTVAWLNLYLCAANGRYNVMYGMSLLGVVLWCVFCGVISFQTLTAFQFRVCYVLMSFCGGVFYWSMSHPLLHMLKQTRSSLECKMLLFTFAVAPYVGYIWMVAVVLVVTADPDPQFVTEPDYPYRFALVFRHSFVGGIVGTFVYALFVARSMCINFSAERGAITSAVHSQLPVSTRSDSAYLWRLELMSFLLLLISDIFLSFVFPGVFVFTVPFLQTTFDAKKELASTVAAMCLSAGSLCGILASVMVMDIKNGRAVNYRWSYLYNFFTTLYGLIVMGLWVWIAELGDKASLAGAGVLIFFTGMCVCTLFWEAITTPQFYFKELGLSQELCKLGVALTFIVGPFAWTSPLFMNNAALDFYYSNLFVMNLIFYAVYMATNWVSKLLKVCSNVWRASRDFEE